MKKNTIRACVRRLAADMDAAERQLQSQRATDLLERAVRRRCRLPDEIDIAPLAARLGDVRIVLPRVEDTPQGEPRMEFYDYRPDSLAAGAYGIREPQGGEACPAADIDVMVVPGMAFTRDGRRLGRGKGYYDRYLAREGFRAWCIGVCFGCQIVDDLPCEPFDRRVDEVVTGRSL